MKRFQFVSDLHLDLKPTKNISYWKGIIKSITDPVVPNLILAGDIGKLTWKGYPQFLKYCTDNWKNVFLVPGNHEYYNSDICQGDIVLKNFTDKFSNLYLLQNNHYIIDEKNCVNNVTDNKDGFHILGCTLWSNIPSHAVCICKKVLNDFYAINGMTIERYNFYHTRDRKWLEDEINKIGSIPSLIVTHHAPLLNGVSHPKYEADNRTFNHAFCSDLGPVFNSVPKGSGWIFGHTHHRTRFEYNGCTVTSNAFGYPAEKFTTRYEQQYLEFE